MGQGIFNIFSELTNKYLDVININSESILCVNNIWYNVTEACLGSFQKLVEILS